MTPSKNQQANCSADLGQLRAGHLQVLLHTLQVVDNSSAFRMQEGIPLVIPEVNPEAMDGMKAGKGGIIANPNCSTIIALMAVTPLHRAAGVKRMVVSTYQVFSQPPSSSAEGAPESRLHL